jgi:opacity protein-like surface antigen
VQVSEADGCKRWVQIRPSLCRLAGIVAFAWQLGAGFQYDFSPGWSVHVSYRYKRIENATVANSPGTEMESTLASHNVQISIVCRF